MEKRLWPSKKQSSRNQNTAPIVHSAGQSGAENGQTSYNFEAPDFVVEALQKGKVRNSADLSMIVAEILKEEGTDIEEPTLVELDDDGCEVRAKVSDSAWRNPTGEFAQDAFIACHIKKWGTRVQKARWNRVISEMRSVYGEEIKVRRAWVQHIIQWAKQKNEGRYAVAITMDNLITALDNSNYEHFKKIYYQKHREERE